MTDTGSREDRPQDDARTVRSHAGEAITDSRNWPGYLLIVLGIIAVGTTLTAAGGGFEGWTVIGSVASVVLIGVGVVLVLLERRRVKRLEGRALTDPGGH